LFKEFDLDDKGAITIGNIKKAMLRIGRDLSKEEMGLMLEEHDVGVDGAIDFRKFKEIMLSDSPTNESSPRKD